MKPPYQASNGNWYTRGLFREQVMLYPPERRPEIDPPFSLYRDHPGCINARKTFVEEGDPTGYKWAMKYLGDWEHWCVLLKCTWFKEALTEWQKELEAKLQSEAMDRIRAIAQDETDKSGLVAAKYLADKAWKDKKTPSTRGRPSAAEITGELKRQAQDKAVEDEDAARIQLKVVK